jgi:hypothetical protein
MAVLDMDDLAGGDLGFDGIEEADEFLMPVAAFGVPMGWSPIGLDLALLIHREHHGVGRWIDIEANNLPELVSKGLVVGQLELRDAPSNGFPGGSVLVRTTTRSMTGWASGGMRGGRVLSRNRPSTPARMKRSCQRLTTDLLLPVCCMIAVVPRPAAVSSTIRQRQACFCGLSRLAATASRRARSAVLTVTMIPLRIPKTPTAASP